MQCSSVECSLAQWKNIRPRRPEFGLEGKHFVTGNSFLVVFGGAAKLRWEGGGARSAAPRWGGNEPKKTGARSAWARMRGQNLLVLYNQFATAAFAAPERVYTKGHELHLDVST
jgi:hypothetical protein